MIFFTIFVKKFANFNKMSYLCTVFDAAMVESVDTKDFEKAFFRQYEKQGKECSGGNPRSRSGLIR